jgi:hypothetical protein
MLKTLLTIKILILTIKILILTIKILILTIKTLTLTNILIKNVRNNIYIF